MQNKIVHKSLWYVLLATIAFANAGCEKLGEPRRNLPVMEAIPEAFGELVGVTPNPEQSYGAVLWFEQPDKTIVAVRVNIARGQIAAKTVKFTRN